MATPVAKSAMFEVASLTIESTADSPATIPDPTALDA